MTTDTALVVELLRHADTWRIIRWDALRATRDHPRGTPAHAALTQLARAVTTLLEVADPDTPTPWPALPDTSTPCWRCHGAGWVCEDHPAAPWATDGPTCPCDAPGAPCPTCSPLIVRNVA